MSAPPPAAGFLYPALAVTDLAVSIAFYEKLGFALECGGPEQMWCMMERDGARLGLYQGMFPADMITIVPKDARAAEAKAQAAGVQITHPTSGETGPTHFMVTDPDGRTIMFDQITD